MQIHIEDRRLQPILEKVQAGVRLGFEDGVALYRTSDILAVGYMANLVRERMHGNVTWFNVNRHINPTDVCVASCKLCAFGKRAKDPKAYTWSLEEVWHRAGEGWSEAVTEFHIVGGLHPGVNAGLVLRDAARAEAALSGSSLEGVHHGGSRISGATRQALHPGNADAPDGCRRRFPARRRRRNLSRSRTANYLRSQNRRGAVAGSGSHGAPVGFEIQLHYAVWPH